MNDQQLQALADRLGISPAPQQALAIDQVGGLLHRIASTVISQQGYFTCVRDGQRTVILPQEVQS